MKKFRKLTAGLLGVVMALSVCSFTALAEDTVEVKDETDLESAIEYDNVNIVLMDDITLTKAIVIGNNKNININLNNNKLIGVDKEKVIQFGVAGGNENYENSGRLAIENGTIEGYVGIINCFGTVTLGDDLVIDVSSDILQSYGGKIIVDGADMSTEGYGISLFNSYYVKGANNNPNSDDENNRSAELIFESGKIEAGAFAISGNNLYSAGTKVTISGGNIVGGIGIYWPMEGNLEINGGHIEGLTGIEARMGNITVSGNAEIVGTDTDVSDYYPESGGISSEGSAIRLTTQIYGNADTQYRDSNELKLTINGGTLTSTNGKGVTIYNAERTSGSSQQADIKITGGDIDGEISSIKYVDEDNQNSEATIEESDYTTGTSNTKLTVSGDVTPAAISAEGKTVFYTDVNDAVKEANKADSDTEIAVFGEAKISTDVELKENVKLVVAPGAELKADVSATDYGKAVVTETDSNGNTIYKVVDIPATPEENYEAFISNNGKVSYFDSLESAVKTVQDGQTIELLKNCDGKVEVTREVEFSVDNKGYDYSIVDGDGYVNIGKGDDYEFITEDDYNDSKRPSHSYSLEEGRVDRDDDKEEPVVTTEPEEEAGPFSDVGKDNPNYDAIIKVYENGWMEGIGDGVFAPNGTLTRAMGAMVLWNKAGNPEPQNVAPFLDVTGDAWYAKAVAWAYEQGIIAGYDAATFGPDDALTTEQFTRMNDIATGNTPAVYVGGAPNATRGWVASLLAL